MFYLSLCWIALRPLQITECLTIVAHARDPSQWRVCTMAILWIVSMHSEPQLWQVNWKASCYECLVISTNMIIFLIFEVLSYYSLMMVYFWCESRSSKEPFTINRSIRIGWKSWLSATDRWSFCEAAVSFECHGHCRTSPWKSLPSRSYAHKCTTFAWKARHDFLEYRTPDLRQNKTWTMLFAVVESKDIGAYLHSYITEDVWSSVQVRWECIS